MAVTLSPIHENIQKTLLDKMGMLQKSQFKEMSDKGVPIYGGANNIGAIGEPVTDGTTPKFNYMFTINKSCNSTSSLMFGTSFSSR